MIELALLGLIMTNWEIDGMNESGTLRPSDYVLKFTKTKEGKNGEKLAICTRLQELNVLRKKIGSML